MTNPAKKQLKMYLLSLNSVEEPTLHELENKASVGSWEEIWSSVLHAATEAEGFPMDQKCCQCNKLE